MSRWRKRARRKPAWTPRDERIGSGESWLPSPVESLLSTAAQIPLLGMIPGAILQAPQLAQVPGNYLSQGPSFTDHPVQAAGHAALGALFAIPEAIKWGAGTQIGLMQQLGQTTGVNDPNAAIDVRERARQYNFEGLEPLLTPVAQAALGPERGAQLVEDLVPDSLETAFNWLDSRDEPKTLPPVKTVADIYNPQQANERFRAVAPQPLEITTDILGGQAGLTGAVGAAKAGLGAVRQGLGLNTISPMAPSLLGRTQIPQSVRTWLETPQGKAVAKWAPHLLPATLAAEQAATTERGPEAGETSDYYLRAGERAAMGLVVGYMGTAAGIGVMSALKVGTLPGLSSIPAAASPETRALLAGRNEAIEQVTRQTRADPFYPGSVLGWVQDQILDQLTGSAAGLAAVERIGIARRTSGVAATEAGTSLGLLRTTIDDLERNTLPPLRAAYESADEAYQAAKIAEETASKALAQAKSAAAIAARTPANPAAAQTTRAVIQAEADLSAAKSARAAARTRMETANQEWESVAKPHQRILKERERLEDAAARGAHAVPFMDEPYKLNRLFSGLDGSVQARMDETMRMIRRRRTERVMLPAGRAPARVEMRQVGIDRNEEQLFDEFMSAFGTYYRVFKGDASWVGTQAAGKLLTDPIEAEKYLRAFIKDRLGNDYTTYRRFRNTLRLLTERHNEQLKVLADEGFISQATFKKITDDNFFYLRGESLQPMLDNMTPQAALQAERLFASARGVEFEADVRVPFTMSVRANLDRDAMLQKLIGQNRIFRSLTRMGDADPLGVGHVVRRFTPEAEVSLGLRSGRLSDLQGERVRVQGEIRRLNRRINVSGGGQGTLQGQVNKHARLLTQAQVAAAKPGLSGKALRDAQGRVAKWQAALQRSDAALQQAQRDLTLLQERLPVLGRQITSAENTRGNLAKSAKQGAWAEALASREQRVQTLTANAASYDAQAAAIVPVPGSSGLTGAQIRKKDDLLARARRARAQAAKTQKAIDDQKAAGVPDPSGMVEQPPGWKVFPSWENGAANPYMVPDWMADYLTGVGTPQVDVFTRVLGANFSRLWRGAVTTYSLSFAFRNPLRDVQTALVNYTKMRSVPEFLRDYAVSWADVVGTVGYRSLVQETLEAFARSGKGAASLKAGEWADKLDDFFKNRALTERFYKAGSGTGSFIESTFGSAQVAGPLDLLKKMALINELPARVAVFRHGVRGAERAGVARGAADFESAFYGRTVLTDFSKAGHAMRVANMFMPLLNARVQGELQTFNAFQADPRAFIGRVTSTVGMPYVTSYVWNRVMFGDLMDQISPDILSRNAVVIYGKWYNEKQQREEPLYFKIPMTEVGASTTIPLRYMLDEQYHRETAAGQPLESGKRSQWTPTGALRQIIAGWIPTNPRPSELDPFGLIDSAINMNPIMAIRNGLASNQDRFRGRPIMDDEAPYLWDQYRWTHPDTSVMAQVATELFGAGGAFEVAHFIPAQADFAIKYMGGGLIDAPIGPAADWLLRAAYERMGRTVPSDKMLTEQELQDAPRAFAKYVSMNRLPDQRPDVVKNLPFLFGAGGNAQTIRERLRQENPRVLEKWDQTLDYQNAMREYDIYEYEPRLREIYAHIEDWSHAKINDEVTTLGKQRQEYRRQLKDDRFPLAITDPKERRAFADSVPGIASDVDAQQALMALPDGVNIDSLIARWQAPQGMEPMLFAGLNPEQQMQMRQVEIESIAKDLSAQYGQPVSADTVERAIVAKQRGLEIPALPLPETYVDEWLDLWRDPPNFKEGDPPEKMRAARALVLTQIVNDYGIVDELQEAGAINPGEDPQQQAEQTVLEIINSRFLRAGDPDPLDISRDKAYGVSGWIHDPVEFPDFTDRDGTPIGTPDERREWAQLLDQAKMYPKERWTPELQVLDRLHRYGEMNKVIEMYNNGDYLDYSRWFGVGRGMTPYEWQQYQSGEVPKYTMDGTPTGAPVPADISLQMDFYVSLYQAMPDSAERDSLAPIVKRIRDMAVPNWRNLLDVYELQPESQRALADDLADLQAQREAEQQRAYSRYAAVQSLG